MDRQSDNNNENDFRRVKDANSPIGLMRIKNELGLLKQPTEKESKELKLQEKSNYDNLLKQNAAPAPAPAQAQQAQQAQQTQAQQTPAPVQQTPAPAPAQAQQTQAQQTQAQQTQAQQAPAPVQQQQAPVQQAQIQLMPQQNLGEIRKSDYQVGDYVNFNLIYDKKESKEHSVYLNFKEKAIIKEIGRIEKVDDNNYTIYTVNSSFLDPTHTIPINPKENTDFLLSSDAWLYYDNNTDNRNIKIDAFNNLVTKYKEIKENNKLKKETLEEIKKNEYYIQIASGITGLNTDIAPTAKYSVGEENIEYIHDSNQTGGVYTWPATILKVNYDEIWKFNPPTYNITVKRDNDTTEQKNNVLESSLSKKYVIVIDPDNKYKEINSDLNDLYSTPDNLQSVMHLIRIYAFSKKNNKYTFQFNDLNNIFFLIFPKNQIMAGNKAIAYFFKKNTKINNKINLIVSISDKLSNNEITYTTNENKQQTIDSDEFIKLLSDNDKTMYEFTKKNIELFKIKKGGSLKNRVKKRTKRHRSKPKLLKYTKRNTSVKKKRNTSVKKKPKYTIKHRR